MFENTNTPFSHKRHISPHIICNLPFMFISQSNKYHNHYFFSFIFSDYIVFLLYLLVNGWFLILFILSF